MSQAVSEANRRSDDEGSGSALRALGAALALWLAGAVGGNVVSAVPTVAVVVREGGLPEELPAWAALAGQILLAVSFLVVGAVYVRRWLGGFDWARPTSDDWRWVAVGLGGAVAVWLANVAISSVLEVDEPTSTFALAFDEPWAMAALVALTVTVVPVAEEVLFRGAIQRRLSATLGRWPAVVLASLAFLSIHLLNYVGGSALAIGLAFGTLFGVSVVIGYVYERSTTLAVPVLVHALYNAVQVAGGAVGSIG